MSNAEFDLGLERMMNQRSCELALRNLILVQVSIEISYEPQQRSSERLAEIFKRYKYDVCQRRFKTDTVFVVPAI